MMTLLFAILLTILMALPLASADWPMFHSNAAHSGIARGNATVNSTLIWRRSTGNQVWSSPAVANGTVYIGSSDHYVYALNASTGAEVWRFATNGEVRSSPAVEGGMVYVGSMDNSVYALDASSGSMVWNFTTGNYVDSSPTVVAGVVYVGSLDGHVYALNSTTGANVWSYATGNAVVSSPAVAGGTLYIGSMDHNVYALDAVTGAKIWNYTAGLGFYSPPSVAGGVVYIGSWDKNVYALNASTGAKLWSFATGDYANSCPTVYNGVVYTASKDGNVYALYATNGSKLWSFATGNAIGSSPAVGNGVVYVGSEDGVLYALNASTGSKVWSYRTGGAIVSSPAVVGNVIYIGSYDGSVYAFGGSTPSSPSEQVWVPTPASAAEAVVTSAAVLGVVTAVVAFVTNPLAGAAGAAGERTEGLLPDKTKEWLEEFVASKRKLHVDEKKGSPYMPTGFELVAYATSIILLTIAFSYVKVPSLDQIWALLPVFFATSILVGLVQKYASIVFMRKHGVWSEHKIWPLGLVLFLVSTLAFKVPFSSPTCSAHPSTKHSERLGALAASFELLVGLALAGMFFLLLSAGFTGIGGAGLAMCVLGALSGALPVAPMSGKDIFDHSKALWAILFVVVVIVFCSWLFLL